jgi:AcrR family transcriptional regulator
MKEWIPIPGTVKEKLIKVALEEFSLNGFKSVNITKLAEKANTTTGAVYHHFGSKYSLYEVIRTDMEQRIIDRMEGAASLFDQPNKRLEAALITALDFAVKSKICRLLSEDLADYKNDQVKRFIYEFGKDIPLPLEVVIYSSWRSILKAISEDEITYEQGKDLLKWLLKRELN